VGLIAREIEAAGVPTLCMTSAWDITEAVAAPRAAYVHHPLGHQTGAPGDAAGQRALVRAALEAAIAMQRPGEIVELPFRWQQDAGWEACAYTPESTPTGPDGKPIRDPAPQ
jgi:D-proline reductase (dithiol) PrdB